MQMLNNERRALSRVNARYLRFFSPVPGMVLNLSSAGMGVEVLTELHRGTPCELRVRHHSEVRSIAVTVRWCFRAAALFTSSDSEVSLYSAGLELERPLSDGEFRWLVGSLNDSQARLEQAGVEAVSGRPT